MALVTRPPTKHDWATVRPMVERFRKEQHTADWIARQLGARYGYRVTKKMVYDRLREWQTPPKYQRWRQQTSVARAVNTPLEDVQLHQTLSSVGVFLDDLAEKSAWQSAAPQSDLHFQRLVAEALMAISSTSYDTRAIWEELIDMEERVESIVSTFGISMHPRVLSVLLRLLVQNQATSCTEREAVHLVKQMIWRKSILSLQPSHPVPSLCALTLTPARTKDFLEKFSAQVESRLHGRIRDLAPDFVASEKVYFARALASFGYPGTADTVLESAASLHMCDAYTVAEYNRTVGFSQFQKNTPGLTDSAQERLRDALHGFQSIGRGGNVEAMYVHYNLSSISERKQDLEGCVHHLEAALEIWEANGTTHQRRGGIKYVRDLHEAYRQLHHTGKMQNLRERYPEYFEESPMADVGS